MEFIPPSVAVVLHQGSTIVVVLYALIGPSPFK